MYQTHRLDNGLRIATFRTTGTESVALAVWVKVGGRYESYNISGVSHFIEHMLFKGTAKRTTRQIKEAIEGVGGMLNAYTSEECTCYMAKVLKKDYAQALDVLADMVGGARLTSSDIKKERTVILEEIKMYYDLPMHYVHEVLMELFWPRQSLGKYIAGTVEGVSKLSGKSIRNFKKKYYHPKNIVITVFGDVAHHDVVEQVEELFSKPNRFTVSKFKAAMTVQRALRTKFLDRKTEQTHFALGVHSGSRLSSDRYTLGTLNIILGGNMSSRLFEQVREQRGLAYTIRSGFSAYQDAGCMTISAGVDNRKCLKAVKVILRELDKLAEKPVGGAELRRAKDYYSGQLLLGTEDALDHMLWMGERYVYTNDLPNLVEIRKSIEAVTAKDIQKLVRKLFWDQYFSFVLIGQIKDKMVSSIQKVLKR